MPLISFLVLKVAQNRIKKCFSFLSWFRTGCSESHEVVPLVSNFCPEDYSESHQALPGMLLVSERDLQDADNNALLR